MEHLCAVAHPAELGKWFPLLLKQLYDEDLVDEDVRACFFLFIWWFGFVVWGLGSRRTQCPYTH